MHSNDGARNVWAKGVIATALGVWLAVVVLTTSKHEFWRDEVRALTLARAAESPLDLYGLVQDQGHPVLWYLLLYLGTSIADTPRVLPITSVVIAFAAVALFMIAAPFPLWFRCAFIFGALPLYEYSVMARNYGISMLLLFVAAVLYRKRGQHPIRLALVLALLANTNVHSAVLVGMIAGVWIFEELIGSASLHGTRSFGRPVVQSFGRSVVRVVSPKPRIGEGGSLGLPDEVASNRGAESGRSDPLPGRVTSGVTAGVRPASPKPRSVEGGRREGSCAGADDCRGRPAAVRGVRNAAREHEPDACSPLTRMARAWSSGCHLRHKAASDLPRSAGTGPINSFSTGIRTGNARPDRPAASVPCRRRGTGAVRCHLSSGLPRVVPASGAVPRLFGVPLLAAGGVRTVEGDPAAAAAVCGGILREHSRPGGSGRRQGAALGLGRYPLGEERQPQAREVSAQLGSLSGRDSRS